jgi:hypothetical protein
MTVLFIGSYYVIESYAWLIFHKPEYKGKIIDSETKEPIEGAVVVVVYEKHVYGPAGGYSSVVKVKEVLTDKKGNFLFPTYSTIINPFSKEDDTYFIIYKPGYGNFPINRISPPSGISSETLEKYFLAKTFGNRREIPVRIKAKGNWIHTKQKVTFGLVELPPMKTRKERLRAIPGGPTDFGPKELPLLFKAMNEENKRFGLGEVK